MSLSRREFVKYSTLGLAGLPFISQTLFDVPAPVITGIQLYSVRSDMQKDALSTLRQLAAMGYKNVEHANYTGRKFYGYSALEFKKILDDLGLAMHSGHTRFGYTHYNESTKDFTDEWKQTIDDAAAVGQQFVISPWLDDQYRKSADTLIAYMDVFNRNGELCKKAGLKFGYHNHNFEFTTRFGGVSMYELILLHTDPKLVAQQIDIGNMFGAGGKAQDLIKKYAGRFELMHVKDEIKSTADDNMNGYESTVIGAGLMKTRLIADLGRKIGITKHFIVEQESYQGRTPLDSAKIDLAIMKKWGY